MAYDNGNVIVRQLSGLQLVLIERGRGTARRLRPLASNSQATRWVVVVPEDQRWYPCVSTGLASSESQRKVVISGNQLQGGLGWVGVEHILSYF